MLFYAIILFAITAIGGLILAAHVFRGKIAPSALSIGHALLGATGLILLFVLTLYDNASQSVTAGLIMMLVSSVGSFYLASFHVRKRLPSKC